MDTEGDGPARTGAPKATGGRGSARSVPGVEQSAERGPEQVRSRAERPEPTRPDVLVSREPVDPARVADLLAEPARWELRHVTVTGSTNADLARHGRGLPDGTVLIAEEQLRGRGRADRVWSCPRGAGLMFSVLHRLPGVEARWRGWAGAVLGLALAHSVTHLTGLRANLKWPNDVLLGDRKCAGLLGEIAGEFVVIGAGLNVTLDGTELPRPDATSLLLAGSGMLDRARLLAAVLDEFGAWLDRWSAGAGDVTESGVRDAFREACSTLGSQVRLTLPDGATVSGTATDVTQDGAIVVVRPDGRRQSFGAGDVVHLRPASAQEQGR